MTKECAFSIEACCPTALDDDAPVAVLSHVPREHTPLRVRPKTSLDCLRTPSSRIRSSTTIWLSCYDFRRRRGRNFVSEKTHRFSTQGSMQGTEDRWLLQTRKGSAHREVGRGSGEGRRRTKGCNKLSQGCTAGCRPDLCRKLQDWREGFTSTTQAATWRHQRHAYSPGGGASKCLRTNKGRYVVLFRTTRASLQSLRNFPSS